MNTVIKYKQFICVVFAGLMALFQAKAENAVSKADSIMLKFFDSSEYFDQYIDEYFATVYIKGGNDVVNKNFLYHFAPDFLYMEREVFLEALVEKHYRAPYFYSSNIKALSNTRAGTGNIEERLMQFLQINIYNPRLINNEIRLPEKDGAFRYYRFEYLSETDTLGYKVHQIAVAPKILSKQLISGIYYIVDGLNTVIRADFTGKREFARFRITTDYYSPGDNFPLPSRVEISFSTDILGNKTENHYSAFFDYTEIVYHKTESTEKQTYNLSSYFGKEADSAFVITDDAYWEKHRPVPLTAEESAQTAEQRHTDSISQHRNLFRKFNNIAKGIFVPRRFKYYNSQIKYSGIINPLELSYSKLDGLVYWQQFSYLKTFANGHELQFSPSVGLLFQRSQAYFRTPVRWLFQPRRFGEFYFNFENRNQTYGYKTVEMLNEALSQDSISFEDLNLDYFNHFKMSMETKFEIANGLIMRGGANIDRYIPVKKDDVTETPLESSEKAGNVEDLVNDEYRTFSPMLGLEWTPGQYYRIEGKNKRYIGSRFPTVNVEFAWSAKILDSKSDFSKLEIDIQQKIQTGLMSSFQYFVGAGWFLNTGSTYFSNFNRFRKHNFPQSWGDPIGGVFHLLGGQWYDASQEYVQAHIMYDYPCTVLSPFRRVTKDIVKERVYLSQLYTPSRTNYSELGCGVGNFAGNIAVFVSFRHFHYESIGVKFAFELVK
ncbi:MAG: DUF5686 family protein [Dysgonamonadaceae bacterium]|jgi:hypothetical protein|nr:DUF5686 family protein [Dysgonamonadaceae bacterium]